MILFLCSWLLYFHVQIVMATELGDCDWLTCDHGGVRSVWRVLQGIVEPLLCGRRVWPAVDIIHLCRLHLGQWRIGGALLAHAPPTDQNFFNFMGFFRKCINILGRHPPPPGFGAPSYDKFWIRPCGASGTRSSFEIGLYKKVQNF